MNKPKTNPKVITLINVYTLPFKINGMHSEGTRIETVLKANNDHETVFWCSSDHVRHVSLKENGAM